MTLYLSLSTKGEIFLHSSKKTKKKTKKKKKKMMMMKMLTHVQARARALNRIHTYMHRHTCASSKTTYFLISDAVEMTFKPDNKVSDSHGPRP